MFDVRPSFVRGRQSSIVGRQPFVVGRCRHFDVRCSVFDVRCSSVHRPSSFVVRRRSLDTHSSTFARRPQVAFIGNALRSFSLLDNVHVELYRIAGPGGKERQVAADLDDFPGRGDTGRGESIA